jgi:Protein of unknown function (DUF2637)
MTGRWAYRTSAAGVLVLAAAAFTLSYDALHQLALDSRVRPALAWLWPVVIDGTIVVALLTVLAAKRAARRASYPWALAGLFSAASVAFNIAHAPTGQSPSWCSPWPPSAWSSPPTCSCSKSVGDGQQPGPTAPEAEQPTRSTAAHAGRPSRTRAAQSRPGRTVWRSFPGTGGLRGSAGGRADPNRRRPRPSRRCQ